MLKIYGITNCQTVQKALSWLKDNQLEYEFHDYKKLGIQKEKLQQWCDLFGWEKVLNRAGMMWRKSPEELKSLVVDQQSSINFMLQIPSAIKRPIVESGELTLIGFKAEEYAEKLLN